ncbi:hypothetical protein BCR32DRAFT_324062 [Anaeromyces robustus]|uniref:GPI ethanolamine phosphate transferase 2 C-terminal domain-containing protein n=1 Tax=Anaeromyces robustus TaxID=1754192 RepID=A0A1Y1XR68_9FUNG|nr:hypothetical protein BCR32DRAFT_324062 [Anaeromyces robustus]|eukprot:ORX88269.1 hypothetical protein BCR32DRAFT_324062 [Anaeromyces robustus]
MDIRARYSRMVKSKFPKYGQSIKRKTYRNIIWLELFIFVIMFSGVLIFSQGYLLTRRALENNNQCNLIKQGNLWNQKFNFTNGENKTIIEDTPLNIKENCWYPSHYKKAVVLIIDALRYDFLHWEDDVDKQDPYNSNKLTIIHKLLKEQPNNAFEFQFKSDPPTTTMQRLKGLTTGTLPTFIDAGKNFAASAIVEDNLIQKIVSNGKRIKFMGDDTWMSLFGDYLDEKSIPCDSLNVWDLYSVDNKVKDNLFPSLKQKEKDWDILFAHFLGVDHCGHRYSSSNEHMELKLREMNGVIENVIEEIDKDTLLIVMGDHGMTNEGDHGGETEDELNSAIFFYSKKGLIDKNTDKEYFKNFIKDLKPIETETEHELYRTIPQIDFTSTFALLLGLPIPFENIGTVIPELFWYPSPYGKNDNVEANILQNLMEALRINTYQLHNFVEIYYSNNINEKNIYKEKYQAIEKELQDFLENHKDGKFENDIEELRNIIFDYIKFNRQTLTNFRQVWTKFNVPLFRFGIYILIFNLIFQVVYLLSNHNIVDFNSTHHYYFPFGIGSITAILIYYGVLDKILNALFGISLNLEPYQVFLGGFSIGACIGYILSYIITSNGRRSIIDHIKSLIFNQQVELVPIILIIAHGLLINSDSYIIFEDAVIQYLVQSVGAYLLYKAFKQQIGQIRNKMITFTVIFMILNRIISYYELCRDEKTINFICDQTIKTNLPNYYIYVVVLIFYPILLKRVLTDNYYSITKLIVRYLIPSILALSAFYWGIDTFETLSLLPTHLTYLVDVKYYVARFGFVIVPILTLAIWLLFPVTFETKMEQSELNNNTNVLNFHGNKNHLGSSYLLFLAIISITTLLVSKPIGGIVIILSFGSFVCLLEICSLEKESKQIMENAEIYWNNKPAEEKIKLLEELEEGLVQETSDDKTNNNLDSNEINKNNKGKNNNNNNNNKSRNKNKNSEKKYFYHLKTKDNQFMILSHEELNEIAYENKPSFDVPLIYVVTTAFLTLQIFFRSGHQSTLQSIDWSIAFVGQKELNFVKAGINLILNILSGEIICCLFMPLFAFWKQETTNEYEKPMVKSICKSLVKYSLAYGFPQVMSIIVASTHRRHLMLWRVFAPRYIIGGISLCFVQVFSIISVIAIIFMVRGITNHLKKIEEINQSKS